MFSFGQSHIDHIIFSIALFSPVNCKKKRRKKTMYSSVKCSCKNFYATILHYCLNGNRSETPFLWYENSLWIFNLVYVHGFCFLNLESGYSRAAPSYSNNSSIFSTTSMKFKLRIHSDEMSTSFDRTLAIFILNFIFIFLFQLKIDNCYSFSEKKKKEILLKIKETYQDYNYVFFF